MEHLNKLRQKCRDYSISGNIIHGYTNHCATNSKIFVNNFLQSVRVGETRVK